MTEIIKDYEHNLKYRLELLTEAKNNTKLQSLLIKACEEDPIYFCNYFCWTYDPRTEERDLPFITYDFQDQHLKDLVWCIENDQDFIFDKSRDMGASWLAVVIQYWGWRFKGWGQLYGSYKENYVDEKGNLDSNFERLRYLISRLPHWMNPPDMIDKYMNISSESIGADIAGDSGANFGTGGRRKVVWLDEFSYWQYDFLAFRKTADITNCRIFFGTPNGRFNIFGKIMTGHDDYRHLKFKKKSLIWSLHPLKTKKWYEEQKLKRTKLDMAKEIDLSYDESVQGAVYKDFARLARFGKYKFDPQKMLYSSWDFGRDTTAIIWMQKDFDTDEIYIIDAYENKDKDIEFYAAFITGLETAGFNYIEEEKEIIEKHSHWKHKYANHFGDPYNGDSKSVVTQSTVKTQLAKYGINLTLKTGTSLEERIKKTELAIRRMKVNDSLTNFIQAIVQSRYPKVKENSQNTSEKTKPIHDTCSHFRTALEYAIDNEPRSIKKEGGDPMQRYLDKLKSKNT